MADEKKMTLDKFEEAYEDVKKVTLDLSLFHFDHRGILGTEKFLHILKFLSFDTYLLFIISHM